MTLGSQAHAHLRIPHVPAQPLCPPGTPAQILAHGSPTHRLVQLEICWKTPFPLPPPGLGNMLTAPPTSRHQAHRLRPTVLLQPLAWSPSLTPVPLSSWFSGHSLWDPPQIQRAEAPPAAVAGTFRVTSVPAVKSWYACSSLTAHQLVPLTRFVSGYCFR